MYQGHKNRACWNVALYLFNDYGLYHVMREEVSSGVTLDCAALNILEWLRRAGIDQTPDGYRFSKTAIRLALQHWEK